MRGITLGLAAVLALALGHDLNAQGVTPDRAPRTGRMELHERRELRRDRRESTGITASCDPTAVKFAGTSGTGREEVSFAAIVATSGGITVT